MQNKTELYPATDTAILPVGPVAAACNFPAAETPEYLTFLQELDELHNKLTLLLSSSTSHPSIIEPKTTPAKDATDNDVCAKIDHTTADSAQIAIEHHGKVYNDCDDNRKQANRESENRANDTSDSAKRNNDDRDTTEHKHDDRENNKQSTATRDNNKCDNQQYTPTFKTTRSQTHQQRHRQTDPAPLAIMERNMPPTDNKSDATLAQLWSLLAQLEEINTQFALFLDTLTTPESSTTPSNPLCKQSTQQDAVNANMLDINMLPRAPYNLTPALPPRAILDPAPSGPRPLVLLASGRQTVTVRTPPWPPPMQPTCHIRDLPWHHMPIDNMLPTTITPGFQVTQHKPDTTWQPRVYKPIPCPSNIKNKHYHHRKAPVRLHGHSILTKDFMRPP